MKGIKGRNLVIAITVLMLFACSLSMNLYTMSFSPMFLFLITSSLLFAATNIFLILFKKSGNKKNNSVAEFIKKLFLKLNKKRAENEAVNNEETKSKKQINFVLIKKIICVALYLFVLIFCIDNIVATFTNAESEIWVTTGDAVFLLIMFFIFVVLEKLCKHSTGNTPFVSAMLKNCSLIIKLLCFQILISAVCILLCSLEVFDAHKYITVLLAVYFFYILLFTVISLIIIFIKNKISEEAFIVIPVPFSKGNQKLNFIDFLENSTGITMRSLWSVKYLKSIAPVTILISVVLFWLSTGFVQVEPYQQAAVYRLGVLKDKILQPGIHLVLPYPFEKAEIYDTDTVQKMTIGYKSSEPSDNIWTSSHGSDEYKLLLGNGDELVSINLRLEYKISDLKSYLKSATAPEMILEALAYELVTDKTITTDLSTLLSADRDAFAENFKNELTQKLSKHETGLEVVCVILESIHPPVEISSVYQQIISAEITAEKYILDAQAKANVKIAEAEASYDTAVNTANAENSKKVAVAKTSVAEFNASLDAYKNYGEDYKYQKYLNAVREAYGKANLVILSDDVDGSAIYFGSFSNGEINTQQPEAETVEPSTNAAGEGDN